MGAPDFKKTFLLHSLGELDVLDGKETKISDGEFQYQGATRAVIRYGWPKPVPSFARCLSVTLLPEQARITKIGGREELPPGQTEAFPGDKWHGQHQHHHVKDFWVNGKNYPPGDPPETRWFGEPTSPDYVPGTPDESGGRGKWRLQIRPPAPALNDVFFHALCPRLGSDGPFPKITRLESEPRNAGELNAANFDGVLVQEGNSQAAVFFSRGDQPPSAFSAKLREKPPTLLLVAGLALGRYGVSQAPDRFLTVGPDGMAVIPAASGVVKIVRR